MLYMLYCYMYGIQYAAIAMPVLVAVKGKCTHKGASEGRRSVR